MRILVVDDEPSVAEALASALKSQGYEATFALSGEQCLASIRENPPDGVFLDLVMPNMGGLDVLRKIRLEWPELQVVLITGFPDSRALAQAGELGISAVIEKPTVIKNLRQVLDRLQSTHD